MRGYHRALIFMALFGGVKKHIQSHTNYNRDVFDFTDKIPCAKTDYPDVYSLSAFEHLRAKVFSQAR